MEISTDRPAPGGNVFELDSVSFMSDLFNAAHCHCADGFDEFDSYARAIRNDLGASCTPEQEALLLQGTAKLYRQARDNLSLEIARLEEYVLGTCLHVPAGLRDLESPEEDMLGSVDAGVEEGVEQQLEALREALATEKVASHRARSLKEQYAKALGVTSDGANALSRLAKSLDEKESAAHDIQAILEQGVVLESLLAKAKKLQDDAKIPAAFSNDSTPDLELGRQQALLRHAPTSQLVAMRQLLES